MFSFDPNCNLQFGSAIYFINYFLIEESENQRGEIYKRKRKERERKMKRQ